MHLLLAVIVGLFHGTLWASGPLADFQVIPKNDFNLVRAQQDQIIFATEKDYILKSPLTNFSSYDYYYLPLSKKPEINRWYRDNSHVVLEQAGEFLIIEVRNENQLHELASLAHQEGHSCGMLQQLSATPMVLEEKQPPQPIAGIRADVSQATHQVDINNIVKTMETMVSWTTRYESDPTGETTGEKLKKLFEAVVPAERSDVSVKLYEHRGTPQHSVIIRLQGQVEPEKVVVIGSHIDSINKDDHSFAPGADDNASGTATNLEAFRVLMASGFKPDYSIEIHGYAAEEIGLVGSKEIAEDYRRQGKNILAMVQFDMNAFANGNPKITFVRNGTNGSLTSQLQKLVSQYNSIPSTTGFLFFGTSDHASWKRQGFPVAFPTEDPQGFNHNIHTAKDQMSQINSKKQIEEFAKLAVAYLMHFSSL